MTQADQPVYLDCAATTPIDPRVRDVVLRYMEVEFGNAGSRSHIHGQQANKAVGKARNQIASVADARPEEVIFTSGATEANNLAILGLAQYGEKSGRRHIISTQIEHKAVLEPLEQLGRRGFEIELIKPREDGVIDPDDLRKRLRDDTLLVSIMHVNNETGAIQPLNEISVLLDSHSAYFHVDAAQGFGKDFPPLLNHRIDLISASGHKLYAPKGIGSLIARSERKVARKLAPLMFGGGQEKSLRPGTLPVPLIAGFGLACELSIAENHIWQEEWDRLMKPLQKIISNLGGIRHGGRGPQLGNIISFSFPNLDSEALMLSLKDIASFSNGSACTSTEHKPSHVLTAIHGANSSYIDTTCRISLSHLTGDIPYDVIESRLRTVTS